MLGLDGVLLIPTAGTIAPRLDMSKEELAQFRDRTLSLTSIAGLGRLPQVQMPAGMVDGAAVGLSLIGPRGSDRALLRAGGASSRRARLSVGPPSPAPPARPAAHGSAWPNRRSCGNGDMSMTAMRDADSTPATLRSATVKRSPSR